MEHSPDDSPSSYVNPLTEYLLTLRRNKDTLPYGQLICISASPSITTMAALLRLANAVGPFIAVLQVHADIIDDWSPEGASKLVDMAKSFAFLIWEGGRILNTHKHTGKSQVLSSKEIQRDIDLARKRYTKGIVSVASWAGLASTWIPVPEEQQNGGDRLIPTLRRAARETVTSATNVVKTEISAGQGSHDAQADSTQEEVETVDDDDWRIEEGDSDFIRKTSVISLTHTITQHTEVCDSSASEAENSNGDAGSPSSEECEDSGVEIHTPERDHPAPPTLGRGLVICLPPERETEYNEACLSLAQLHSDFVVGFVSGEAWVNLSDEADFLPGANTKNARHDDQTRTFAVFAPLESEHVFCSAAEAYSQRYTCEHEPDSICLSFDFMGRSAEACPVPSRSDTHHKEIQTLHQVVARALGVRNERVKATKDAESRTNGAEFLFIPVISMNA